MPIPLGILAVAGAGAGSGGSFDLLETTVLGTDTASVTFSSLGSYSAYKHLQIRAVVRGTRAANIFDFWMRINGVSSGYAFHRLTGDGSSVTSGAGTARSQIVLGYGTGANNTANAFGAFVIDVLDFGNTSKNKTVRSLGGFSATAPSIELRSGFYESTSAVTSIELLPEANNFLTGSRFSLYGYK